VSSTQSGAQPSQGSTNARSYMALIAVIGSIGGLLFGYDTGIIASALAPMSDQFGLNTVMEQIVVSSILVGCAVGALGAGSLTDRFGRRRVVAAVAVVFAVAALLSAFTSSTATLILFRFLLGLAVGGASQAIPVYIGELAPQAKRGGLVVTFQLAIIAGILISSVSGIALIGQENSWRWMIALGAVPAVVLALGMIALPESPRYLFHRGKVDEARAVLSRVRDVGSDIDAEIDQIRVAEELDSASKGSWSDLFTPRVRPALLAGLGIAILCQITGVNAIIYYAPTILAGAGFEGTSGLWAGLMNNGALFLMTVLGIWLVDKWGRRKLLLRFIPFSILGLLVLAFSFTGAGSSAPWLTVTGMVMFMAFNGGSLSVAVWLVIAEIFPLRVRGKATALCAAALWIADLAVSLTTLSLVEGLGARGAFLLFTGISVIALVFTYLCIPETKGRSLEAIEESLDHGTFRPATQRRQPVRLR
jgi:MFS transporter, SP family, major inositol transporter